MAVALSLLLSLYGLSSRPCPALGISPGPAIVFLAPVEDEVVPGRYAILAMTLNPRVRIVAGPLVLVRVRTQEPRPLTGTATHFQERPYALAGRIETSCLVPDQYELHATMRRAQGEVDTVVLPVTVQRVQRLGRATCRITQVVGSLHGWGAARG
jgi:hypothetical protein